MIHTIITAEIESPPHLVDVSESDGFILKEYMHAEKRIRAYIYDMLKKARDFLPAPYHLCVYETYRTHQNQIMEWEKLAIEMRNQHPDIDPDSEEFTAICEEFVANPYKHGSGHQTGAAIDLTICMPDGTELDMGTPLNSPEPMSRTHAEGLTPEQRQNRDLLLSVMQQAGFVNYPSEWWHFSFGDRLWAKITGSHIAIFGKLPL
jgi:D-alanyl-D-alanine dipeptidase